MISYWLNAHELNRYIKGNIPLNGKMLDEKHAPFSHNELFGYDYNSLDRCFDLVVKPCRDIVTFWSKIMK